MNGLLVLPITIPRPPPPPPPKVNTQWRKYPFWTKSNHSTTLHTRIRFTVYNKRTFEHRY